MGISEAGTSRPTGSVRWREGDSRPATQGVVVLDRVFHNFLWSRPNRVLTVAADRIPYLVVTPSGGPRDGVGRGNDRSPALAVGRRAFHRGNWPPSRCFEKRCGRQGAPAGSARQAFAHPSRWRAGRGTAADRATKGGRADIASAVQHRPHDCIRCRAGDPATCRDACTQASADAACNAAGAASVRARRHLLLANRGARHAELPLLRHIVRTREAVLLRAREACLREGARPPRGRCLTSLLPLPLREGGKGRGPRHSFAARRIARGVAAINWSCDAGRSEPMKP
jgi:hypothetical protein